ncbi:MAG: hypothetical protein HQ592_08420, partial [Planctomycetes bacterium]|nr:hypothetical protein [Planctomycetota bacterium]
GERRERRGGMEAKFEDVNIRLRSPAFIKPLITGTDTDSPVEGLAGDVDVSSAVPAPKRNTRVDKLYLKIKKQIGVRKVGAEIIQVSYAHKNPEVARNFVSRLIDKLRAEWVGEVQMEYEFPYDLRKKEVDGHEIQLGLAEQELEGFRLRNATELASGDAKTLGGRLNEVTERLNEIKWGIRANEQDLLYRREELLKTAEKISMSETFALSIKARKLNEAIADLEIMQIRLRTKLNNDDRITTVEKRPKSEMFAGSIKARELDEAIAHLEIMLIRLKTKFKPTHQSITTIEAQLEDLEKEREDAENEVVEFNYKTYEAQLDALKKEREDFRKERQDTENEVVEFTRETNPAYLERRDTIRDLELENRMFEGERQSRIDDEKKLREDLRQLPSILRKESEFVRRIKEWQDRLEEASLAEDGAKRRYMLAKEDRIDTVRLRRLDVSASPNIRNKGVALGMGIAATIGLALGLMIAAEQLKPSFIVVDDARRFLSIPSLGVVPVIYTPKDASRRRTRRIIIFVVAGAIIIAGAAIAFFFSEEVSDLAENIRMHLGF